MTAANSCGEKSESEYMRVYAKRSVGERGLRGEVREGCELEEPHESS